MGDKDWGKEASAHLLLPVVEVDTRSGRSRQAATGKVVIGIARCAGRRDVGDACGARGIGAVVDVDGVGREREGEFGINVDGHALIQPFEGRLVGKGLVERHGATEIGRDFERSAQACVRRASIFLRGSFF